LSFTDQRDVVITKQASGTAGIDPLMTAFNSAWSEVLCNGLETEQTIESALFAHKSC